MEAEEGSLSKLARASLTEAYKLMVLMVRSWANSVTDGATGSSGLVKWAAAAVKGLEEVMREVGIVDCMYRCRILRLARPIAFGEW